MDDRNFFNWRLDALNMLLDHAPGWWNNFKDSASANWAVGVWLLLAMYTSPVSFCQTSLRSSYPQSWLDHYHAENYFTIDLWLRRKTPWPLPEYDELFSDTPQFWDAARDHGLRRGISQCVMAPNRAMGFSLFPYSEQKCTQRWASVTPAVFRWIEPGDVNASRRIHLWMRWH